MPAAALESLLDALLYEGYALYPYTDVSAKNATPTPFGIVYPPDYARHTQSAHDRLRLQGIAEAPAGARVQAEVRLLLPAPEGGHRAEATRLQTLSGSIDGLAVAGRFETFDLNGTLGRMRLSAERLHPGIWRVSVCVHNATPVDGAALDRPSALRRSLLSTHPILRIDGGRFVSPLERDGLLGAAVAGCESVNTYPVLATDEDDVLVGATIALPDHPRLAPESRGNLFDGTEIEEALVLHVMALSDGEREQVAAGDPAIRAMIERTAAATPEDLLRLHGRTVLSDPFPDAGGRP
ncbi:MAG TPA: hypothetical protein VGL44_01720 [Gaiellales bacterium]